MNAYLPLLETFQVEQLASRCPITMWQRQDCFSTSLSIRVNFGARHDYYLLDGTLHAVAEGTAHVCEHLTIADPHGLQRVIMTGRHHVTASTYRDFTLFRSSGAEWSRDDIQRIVRGLLNRKVCRDALARELEVIGMEKALRDQESRWTALEALWRTLYPDSPVSRSLFGDPTELKTTPPEEVERCRNAAYGVDHWEVFISGKEAIRLGQWLADVLAEETACRAHHGEVSSSSNASNRAGSISREPESFLRQTGVLALGLPQEANVTPATFVIGELITEAVLGAYGVLRTQLLGQAQFSASWNYGYDCSFEYAHLWATGYVVDGSGAVRAFHEGWARVADQGLPAEVLRSTVELLQMRYFGLLERDESMDLMFNRLRQIGANPYEFLLALSNIEPDHIVQQTRNFFSNHLHYSFCAT